MADRKEDNPYEVQIEKEYAVVRFSRLVDHARTFEHDTQLKQLVQKKMTVVCDFSRTETVGSEWLRLIVDLSVSAKKTGKRVVVVSLVKEILEQTVDALALKKHLTFADSLREAIEL